MTCGFRASYPIRRNRPGAVVERSLWRQDQAWCTPPVSTRSTNLFLLCVPDQHDVTRLNASAESQLFAVSRPIETEQGITVELRYLTRRTAVQRLAPNVISVLPAIDIGQLAA